MASDTNNHGTFAFAKPVNYVTTNDFSIYDYDKGEGPRYLEPIEIGTNFGSVTCQRSQRASAARAGTLSSGIDW